VIRDGVLKGFCYDSAILPLVRHRSILPRGSGFLHSLLLHQDHICPTRSSFFPRIKVRCTKRSPRACTPFSERVAHQSMIQRNHGTGEAKGARSHDSLARVPTPLSPYLRPMTTSADSGERYAHPEIPRT